VTAHQVELLGAYALGVLDGDEWQAVRTHLDDCAACRREVDDLRELEAALGGIPPEAFLDGPPPDGEILLGRTLQQVRRERGRQDTRRRLLWAAAAVVIGSGVLAGGTVAGLELASRRSAASGVAAAGDRTGAATDGATGATMSVAVRPAAGWVRVHAEVGGVPAGEQCRLYVMARDGSRREAGSWLAGAGETTVDGAALLDPAEVTAVRVETFAGQPLVTVAV
jgi:anti-sigma factor RsiW